MSKEQLLHVFEESACLTRRQMKDYVTGGMTNEESHAVEVHLNACPFCNDAVEGMFAQQEGNAAEMIMGLDGDFLQDHLGRNNPRIHLNSVTAAHHHTHQHIHKRKHKNNVTAFWRNTSIAAMLLLAVGLLWFLKFGRDNTGSNRQLAQQTEIQVPPATAGLPPQNTEDARKTVKTIQATAPVEKAAIPATIPADKEPSGKDIAAAPSLPATTAGGIALNEDNSNNAKQKKALTDEIVVTQYKAPLVDKFEPSSKTNKAAEVEKMPTRTTGQVAATAPGTYTGDSKKEITVAKNEDVSYSIESVATRSATSVTKDNLAKANGLFSKGEYESALRVYSREFDSEDKGFRQKAMVMAAQCHAKLGNTTKAKQLLQSVMDEGGPEKKAARKLLNELESSR